MNTSERSNTPNENAFVRSQLGFKFKFRKRPIEDVHDTDMLDLTPSLKSPGSVESASPKTPNQYTGFLTGDQFRPRIISPAQQQQQQHQEQHEQGTRPMILPDKSFMQDDTPHKKRRYKPALKFDDDTFSIVSQSSTNTVNSTAVPVDLSNIPPPPPDVPTSDFHKYIPLNVNDRLRTQLIFYWNLQRYQQRISQFRATPSSSTMSTTGSKQLDGKIRTVITEATQNMMDRMKRGDIYLPKHIGNLQSIPQKPNPVNEQAKEKIKGLDKAIHEYETEMAEWRRLSIKLFDQHAKIKDKLLIDDNASSSGSVSDSDVKDEAMSENEMLKYLDDEFRDFHIDFSNALPAMVENNNEIEANKVKIDAAVTELRRIFFVINRQLEEMRQHTSEKIAQLAKKMRDEQMAKVPVPADRPQPSPTLQLSNPEEAEKIRKENYHLGVFNLLRAFTRLQTSSSEKNHSNDTTG